jgi:hypothetical protein
MHDVFDLADDVGKDVRKAGRRAFRTKRQKKGGARKWAKRNNRQLEELTHEISVLTKHMSTLAANAETKDGKTAK